MQLIVSISRVEIWIQAFYLPTHFTMQPGLLVIVRYIFKFRSQCPLDLTTIMMLLPSYNMKDTGIKRTHVKSGPPLQFR